eukprot:6227428-Prymnesium_polylepis.1
MGCTLGTWRQEATGVSLQARPPQPSPPLPPPLLPQAPPTCSELLHEVPRPQRQPASGGVWAGERPLRLFPRARIAAAATPHSEHTALLPP